MVVFVATLGKNRREVGNALNKKKLAVKSSVKSRLQKSLPYTFLPNTTMLTISDWESVVALENAAFKEPEYRALREKVGPIRPTSPLPQSPLIRSRPTNAGTDS